MIRILNVVERFVDVVERSDIFLLASRVCYILARDAAQNDFKSPIIFFEPVPGKLY